MPVGNSIYADSKAEVYGLPAYIFPSFPVIFLMGESAALDSPVRTYEWNATSTAADDTENIIQPTAVTGAGRLIKGKIQIPADWSQANTAALDYVKNKPTIPAAQIQADWNQASSGAIDFVKNKPTVPGAQQAYEGITLRSGAFPIIKSASVASGVAVFNLTSDGTAGGTALFPNGVIQDSINLWVNDATAAYQMAVAFTNSNKTVTVTANKLTTANILTGILGQASANGAVIKLQVWGY